MVDQRRPSVLDSADHQIAGGHVPLGLTEELKMPQTPSSGSRRVGLAVLRLHALLLLEMGFWVWCWAA